VGAAAVTLDHRRRRPASTVFAYTVRAAHWLTSGPTSSGTLTLGTDNGSAFTARAFKAVLAGLGIAHRRGGYRDPESQAFIESWFGMLDDRTPLEVAATWNDGGLTHLTPSTT
jgi:transposase InsO family protein